jgi:hypothetical protein
MIRSINVHAMWYDEAKVWVASTSDVHGLAAEAPTLELLAPKVLAMLAELIELNGIESDLPEIPVHIMAEHSARIAIPAH